MPSYPTGPPSYHPVVEASLESFTFTGKGFTSSFTYNQCITISYVHQKRNEMKTKPNKQKLKSCQLVMADAFNSSTWEAEAGRSP